MFNFIKCQRGAAMAIYTIIVLGAALIMATVSAESGLYDLEMSFSDNAANKAMYMAEGCLEETMRRIRLNNNYGVGAGDINLSVLDGSCIIQVEDRGDGQRIITAEAKSTDKGGKETNKIIYGVLTINPTGNRLIITGWSEI